MNQPLLQVRDLSTHFSTRAGVAKAVDGVSFDVAAGEIVGLVGESGSGKSVTGYSVLGLVDAPGRIAAGSVKLDGQELIGMPQSRLRALRGRRIAMVFQDPMSTLNAVLKVSAQMELAMLAHGKPDAAEMRRRSVEALAKMGIPEPERRLDSYPHELSGGMRQRVAIAIAFLNNPGLVICDEPTTALDVSIQAQILVEMKTLVRAAGVGLVWISHDLATVSVLASRLLVMYAGRLIEEGPTAQVLRQPRHPYTQGLIDSLPSRAAPGRDLVQIPGATPSLTNLPSGCAFRARCAYATDACGTAPERTFEGERAWRCHHPLHRSPTVPATS
ncbi:ABC transporter ATP-binding protein [uncultured Ramlibacter sp.]|uniref:ABC transporter ATP-binding protein n=1 Tax=uncultured Ramlibacter sp. TaxID=260755 RepID=UPI00263906F3|nr:ABC transporter ATP-binding protein [uncultured Ramlibacter sp.]